MTACPPPVLAKMWAMPKASEGAPPVRAKRVFSPASRARFDMSITLTGKPQEEMVAAAAAGVAPTTPGGEFTAKYTPGWRVQAAKLSSSIEPLRGVNCHSDAETSRASPDCPVRHRIARHRIAAGDFVLSADEKTSIQARRRIHASMPPAPGRPTRIEHEYERRGAWAYLAAWDVHRAKIFGRCEATTGIAPFDRLVQDVMGQEPYRSADRVFWIFDNGSSHRGQKADQRLQSRWPSIIPVHTPVHASWLNQVEIYFSIIQRKVLTPGDFSNLTDLEMALLAFQQRYEKSATPFRWTFTRADLAYLMQRLKANLLRAAA